MLCCVSSMYFMIMNKDMTQSNHSPVCKESFLYICHKDCITNTNKTT